MKLRILLALGGVLVAVSASVVAGELAANSVTASKIVAGTITATQIAANTITAGNIATNTITADRLNVSTLSAITGNMGTLTAGTITGGTIDGAIIRAGPGDEVLLDGSGMTLTSGTAYQNAVNWNDGSQIISNADTMVVSSEGELQLHGTASGVRLSYVSGAVTIAPLGGSGNRYVCVDNNGDLSGGATCGGTAPAPAAEVARLEQEVRDLRAVVAQLVAAQAR